jgi:RNA polymerase sigma-70 factor (ECF subfamily)
LWYSKKISKFTDEELLIGAISEQNSVFFGELYNRYIPLLYGVALNYLQNADNAKDAVMSLYENIAPKIASYDIIAFKTWIYSVMKNHCLQILRKDKTEIFVDFSINFVEDDEILHLLNEKDEQDERLPTLKMCIKKLPVEQRVSVLRFFFEEMSYQDIADSTGYDLLKVKSYIQNGKRNLKICVEKNSK